MRGSGALRTTASLLAWTSRGAEAAEAAGRAGCRGKPAIAARNGMVGDDGHLGGSVRTERSLLERCQHVRDCMGVTKKEGKRTKE